MENEFAPYELALKLKALGFDEPCIAFATMEYKDVIHCGVRYKVHKESDLPTKPFGVPTFSQAFRWFREKYRMFHEVFIDTEPTVDEPDKLEFTYIVLHMVGTEEMHTSKNKRFNTYEEAELACLIKLIELVEQKEK